MRYLLLLACLLFVTTTVADEPEFDFDSVAAKKAFRDYKKAVAKDEKIQAQQVKEVEAEGAKAAKKTREAFIESLRKTLKKSMQAGNLEEANKINAAIKALEKAVSPKDSALAGRKGEKGSLSKKVRPPLIVGVWKFIDLSESKTMFIFRPDKSAYHSGGGMKGQWKATNKTGRDFTVLWSNGVIDNIRISRGNKTLDAFTPSHDYRFKMARDPYLPR